MQIFDAHNDLLMNLKSFESIQNYLKKYCITNEVAKIFAAFYISPQDEKNKSADAIIYEIASAFDLIKSFDSLTPTLENIGFVNSPEILEKTIKLKPFCATLTWNYDNALAGGAYGTSGLTEWGKCVIRELESNNIVVDTAHLNTRSFWEFASITKFPLFCSHTSSGGIYNIPRALNCEQLAEIKATDGFAGLCLYDTLLSSTHANLQTILNHIESLQKYLGNAHLGLGTDFNSSGECNPEGFDIDYNGMPVLLKNITAEFGNAFADNFASKNLQRFMNLIK